MDIKQLDDSAIEVLTVPELKKYLRLYGQYVTGRKVDLTKRLKGIKILSMKNVNKVNSSDDKHVHSIEYHDVSESCFHCIVRCLVIPSIPTSNQKKNPDHRVWVIMSNVTGSVHSADCNC
uniref:SAP domain-containing protein n=1 Tax=Octopus bimaculoides TaxID=37653 RepID=A0A0L8GBT7_OCTBM